jgi:hypothetical protein
LKAGFAAAAVSLALAASGAAAAPGDAGAKVVAVLQGLDKTTARIATIDAPVGKEVRYGSLLITARACIKNPPTETPENSAFLQIEELPPDADPATKPDLIFSGWMFSSSPALSALENPVYDVSVLDCEEVPAPGAAATPGATASPGAATAPARRQSGITAKSLP